MVEKCVTLHKSTERREPHKRVQNPFPFFPLNFSPQKKYPPTKIPLEFYVQMWHKRDTGVDNNAISSRHPRKWGVRKARVF